MLPEFDANGNLPPGTYVTTFDVIEKRYGNNPAKRVRERLTRSLRSFVSFVSGCVPKPIGIYIDGSYVSKKLMPNDVDIAVVFPDDFDLSKEGWRFTDAFESLGLDVFLYRQIADAKRLNAQLDVWRKDKETETPKGIIYLEV